MITIVPNTPEVHWLSTDRDTDAWNALVNTVTIGTEGRELDTGKRYYMDGGRNWKEAVDPILAALNSVSGKLDDVSAKLAAIEYNTGEVIHETANGLNGRS